MQTPKPHVGKAQKKLIFIVVFALLISVLSELLIANYRMLFLYDKEDFPTVDLADYCDSNIAEDGSYVVRTSASGSASLSFSEVPGGIYSIAITLSYANKEVEDYIPVPTVTVTATDPRTSWNAGGFITVAKDMICVGQYGEPVQNTVYASIENHGKGRLRLAFADLAGTGEFDESAEAV